MAMRVERRGDEYCVVISQEALAALRLTEGTAVEVRPVEEPSQPGSIRYVSVEKALDAYHETLPQHREAYRELAK